MTPPAALWLSRLALTRSAKRACLLSRRQLSNGRRNWQPHVADQQVSEDSPATWSSEPVASTHAPIEVAIPPAPSRIRYNAKSDKRTNPGMPIQLPSGTFNFSPILLRDLCECPRCVDPSTKQKLFSTTDIPATIRVEEIQRSSNAINIRWEDDLANASSDHTSSFTYNVLERIVATGNPSTMPDFDPGPQLATDAATYAQLDDITYESFMQDDSVLRKALQQVHTRGLLFLNQVPDDETSVSTIAERIGPVKNTFYGYTWDVRSVAQAKNVAYTSQDLGFHMDLLYMEQPPHIQLLHCIRSSSSGGASRFTDSYRAVQDLYENNIKHAEALSRSPITFHYNHPPAHMYRQTRPVINLRTLQWRGPVHSRLGDFKSWYERRSHTRHPSPQKRFGVVDFLDCVNWSPPFQAPMALPRKWAGGTGTAAEILSSKTQDWHTAAQAFDTLLQRPDGIYERLMKPEECVIFASLPPVSFNVRS